MANDVGSEAIDRPDSLTGGNTYILLDNPATEDGIIDTVELYLHQAVASTFKVCIFSDEGGGGGAGQYKATNCALLGAVDAGSKQTFTGLNLTIKTGEYIGWYFSVAGSIQLTSSGEAGQLRDGGDHTDGGTTYYALNAGQTVSLRGTGAGAAVGGGDMFQVF